MALTSSDKVRAQQLADVISLALENGDGHPIRVRFRPDDAQLILRCIRRAVAEIPRSLEASHDR